MPDTPLHLNDLETITTDDQSLTLRHKRLGVHYRSRHGAHTESMHVFIYGSQILKREKWNVVELGFGTAMNFNNLVAHNNGQPIHYIAIDHMPIPPDCVFGSGPSNLMVKEALSFVRKNKQTCVLKKQNITLEVHPFDFNLVSVPTGFAGAFFHDPFDPIINPDCWQVDCFRFAKNCLDDSGVLATYGAAGHSRRAMAAAGFFIGKTKGPGRKREITFASPRLESLQHTEIINKYPPLKS